MVSTRACDGVMEGVGYRHEAVSSGAPREQSGARLARRNPNPTTRVPARADAHPARTGDAENRSGGSGAPRRPAAGTIVRIMSEAPEARQKLAQGGSPGKNQGIT